MHDKIFVKPKATVSAVRADIEAALKRSATADAKNISVEVQDSKVILAGTARSWAKRDAATNSAWGHARRAQRH